MYFCTDFPGVGCIFENVDAFSLNKPSFLFPSLSVISSIANLLWIPLHKLHAEILGRNPGYGTNSTPVAVTTNRLALRQFPTSLWADPDACDTFPIGFI